MRAVPSIALLLAVAACTSDVRGPAARIAFERFQDALFAGDTAALRQALSRESQQVVAQLPLERIRDRQRLEVVGTRRHDPEVHLRVRDPNQDGAESTYVMVVEDGELRVDLIATTAFNHVERPNPAGGGPRVIPRPLPAGELARIRARGPAPIR